MHVADTEDPMAPDAQIYLDIADTEGPVAPSWNVRYGQANSFSRD